MSCSRCSLTPASANQVGPACRRLCRRRFDRCGARRTVEHWRVSFDPTRFSEAGESGGRTRDVPPPKPLVDAIFHRNLIAQVLYIHSAFVPHSFRIENRHTAKDPHSGSAGRVMMSRNQVFRLPFRAPGSGERAALTPITAGRSCLASLWTTIGWSHRITGVGLSRGPVQ